MPELPEVETVVRQLKPYLQGRIISSLNIIDPRLETERKKDLPGRTVSDVTRLGKQIVLHLSALKKKGDFPLWLVFHLRMSGRLIMEGMNSGQREDHRRAELILDSGRLDFYDLRRFGMLKVFDDVADATPNAVDPTTDEFTARRLKALIADSRMEIKPWLLRQDRLVGIGNIYASEILYHSGIDPRRPVNSLTDKEIEIVHDNTRWILFKAIECCGTTFSDFQDARGDSGTFQNMLAVYGKEGQPCPQCGEPIVRIVQGQRSTFFSPRVQK